MNAKFLSWLFMVANNLLNLVNANWLSGNLCWSMPCMNGGSCFGSASTYICVCPVSYTGALCEKQIGICHNNPCGNHGICIEKSSTSFECRCYFDYTGVTCKERLVRNNRNIWSSLLPAHTRILFEMLQKAYQSTLRKKSFISSSDGHIDFLGLLNSIETTFSSPLLLTATTTKTKTASTAAASTAAASTAAASTSTSTSTTITTSTATGTTTTMTIATSIKTTTTIATFSSTNTNVTTMISYLRNTTEKENIINGKHIRLENIFPDLLTTKSISKDIDGYTTESLFSNYSSSIRLLQSTTVYNQGSKDNSTNTTEPNYTMFDLILSNNNLTRDDHIPNKNISIDPNLLAKNNSNDAILTDVNSTMQNDIKTMSFNQFAIDAGENAFLKSRNLFHSKLSQKMISNIQINNESSISINELPLSTVPLQRIHMDDLSYKIDHIDDDH